MTTPSGSEPPASSPVPGIYQHYKGQHYQVLGMARHSETEEWLVVYQALYGEQGYWTRPLSLWLEAVQTPDARRERFALVTPNNVHLKALTQRS